MPTDFLTHPTLTARHGFFTRQGGVSKGPYASLNASLSGGDDPALVAANRAIVAQAMGVEPDALAGVKQVHGIRVVTVDRVWAAGQGPDADGMVTARQGVALGVITADCAPVLLCDARAGVVGAVHAGWRGAASGVLEAAVQAMATLGAAPEAIAAVVGPCIGEQSYEVGPDLRDAILPSLPDAARFFRPGQGDRFWFDLAAYCVARLGRAGVKSQALNVDTFSDEARFFSHRRRTLGAGGPIGHQISVIVQ
jgi:YfiH family protein